MEHIRNEIMEDELKLGGTLETEFSFRSHLVSLRGMNNKTRANEKV